MDTVDTVDRAKREVEMEQEDADVVVVAPDKMSTHESRCGLSEKNMKKLLIGERPVITLKRRKRRSKRSSQERVIEIAVFVDYEMYSNNKLSNEEATISKIESLVFTYLNAVQLLYSSDLLTNKLRLVLVRLDIMTSQPAELQTAGGDIESYLENFCR